ncbi:hypothetical protein GCM10025867_48570 (plasmid) [Frondihabitans sucicola]|uniref:Uncharacterized protein n=1 Tax=Frondihabitans sucicola TaxID=1268041 RepID=A0ABN6Y630_9MICO|nr:hypothetical protein [Frondihabitans sucicola]BDZ52616.1 hypothetical protein GCM10025867_48570 [Frondihabitans sucicola]
MCRACTDANPRRCPSSLGELRSARDRSAYAANKAAGATRKPTKARSGVKGGLTDATTVEEVPAGPVIPTIAEVRELADGVSDLYSPETRHSDRGKALIAKYGSEDRAVIALGDALTARAEMHAGLTADDISGDTMADRLNAELAAAGVRGRLKLDSLKKEMDELHSIVKSGRSTLTEKIEANARRNEVVDQYNAAIRSAEYKDARVQLQAAQNGTTGESGQKLAKLRDGYTTALAEVRQLGGSLAFHDKTAPKANKVFNEAAQVYPSDWIDASNSQAAPLAKIATARAHYSHGHVERTRKQMPVSYPVLARADEDKTLSNDAHYEYTRDPNQDGVPEGACAGSTSGTRRRRSGTRTPRCRRVGDGRRTRRSVETCTTGARRPGSRRSTPSGSRRF